MPAPPAKRTPSKRWPGLYSYRAGDGVRWGVVINLGDDWQTGKRVQRRKQGFRTQDQARQWQIEQQDRKRRGETAEPSMMPLGQWLDEWLETRTGIATSTQISYRGHLARLAPHLSYVPLARLTARQIEHAYRELIGHGYKPGSVNASHRTLRHALKDATRLGLLVSDPMTYVKAPVSTAPHKTILTVAQMRTLLEGTINDNPWGLVWRILAESWMRVGELLDLRWSGVDLVNGEIRVERSLRHSAQGPVSASGKTFAARRTIPISQVLVDRLRPYQDAQRFLWRAVRQTWTEDVPVLCHPDGRWLSRITVARNLAYDCKRLGLPIMTPHGLRHSGGSFAYAANPGNIKVISQRLGHKDVTTTANIYLHISADQHRTLATSIGDLFDAEPELDSEARDIHVTPSAHG